MLWRLKRKQPGRPSVHLFFEPDKKWSEIMKRLLLVSILIMGMASNFGCGANDEPQEAGAYYNNDVVGNNYFTYDIDKSDITFSVLDFDKGIMLPTSYDKLSFSLYIDGEMAFNQEINSFVVDKAIFMEKPTDVSISVIDENDEIVLSVEMPAFMIYEAEGERTDIVEKYGKAESLAIYGGTDGLEYVSELTGLKYLSIEKNELVDLHFSSNLKNLKKLVVSECKEMRDISSIAEFSKLESVVFNHCYALEDIGPLSELESLKYLILSRNIELEDLLPLAKLTDLEYLRVVGSAKVKDVSFLEEKENLRFDFE